MEPFTYTWVFVVGLFFAFLDAYGIGANDVANSFATSVGSRSLTLAGALTIACFTEMGGAILLGASTTETVKSKIVDPKLFAETPEVLMLGFMCALIGSSTFVVTASAVGWPISTTHSIVGAVGGVGVAAFGIDSLRWETLKKIFISWVAAPGLSGVIAASIFGFTYFFVLKHKTNSLERGIAAIPFYFVVALGLTSFYVITKAPGFNMNIEKSPEKLPKALLVTACCSVFYGAASYFFLVPFLKRYLIEEEDLKWYHFFLPWSPKQPKNENLQRKLDKQAGLAVDEPVLDEKLPSEDNELQKAKNKVLSALTKGVTLDVASLQSEKNSKIHDNAIKFSSKTEYLFSFLQVCTAAFASFAHGSNDVANAAGPLSGIVNIYQTGKIPSSNVPVKFWVLALMGAAIDLGLLTMGWRIMSVLGNNLTYQTPSRGFSMEFGAALAVVTASFLSIPVSTTHCITGATVGVGLCNGNFKAINWKGVLWIMFGWVCTLPVAGGISGAFFFALTNAPKFST